jgi:hypothetical protein
MARLPVKRAWLVVAIVVGSFAAAELAPPTKVGPYVRTLLAQQDEPSSPRARAPVTFLQVNDVYSLVAVDGLGGLARVATLKQSRTRS